MSNNDRHKTCQYKEKTALISAKKQWPINILQWNAGGLSPTKVTELMKELVKHETDIFIIN
jgi:hypothetical protein